MNVTMRRLLRPSDKPLLVILVAGTLLGPVAPVCAQGAPVRRAAATNIQWWHPLAAGAGVATLFLFDEPIRDKIQGGQGDFRDDLAEFTKDFKDPRIFYVTSAGAVAVGLVTRQPKVTATGVHVIGSYGLAAGINLATKWAFGRSRPSATPDDATSFDLVNGGENSAFPSGSAAVVFSLATTLADAVDRTPVSVVLYTGATLNSWARLYSDRHWLSDVAVGALIGLTSAKLVNGEWTVFGLRPPEMWTEGGTLSMGYVLRLP
jgi:membrane-associated phospholipid phosphatase